MKLKPLKANMTELETERAIILFSYKTPVAANLQDGSGFVRTSVHYSPTTTRHINQWLKGAKAREVPQREIDSLLD